MGCPIPSRTANASWKDSAAAGGEGSVVKPEANQVGSRKGPVRAGRKVRGREFLRIIYGPVDTEPGNLDQLRQQGRGHKRPPAARE